VGVEQLGVTVFVDGVPSCYVNMRRCFPCAYEDVFKGIMACEMERTTFRLNEVNNESLKEI
jgi:hypothetical protein